MKNHFHLIATPGDKQAISRMMKDVGGRYATYYNRRYARIGTLWNGRFRAKTIGDEMYCLTCLRYVEQNPVRAKIVRSPQDYRWSTYVAHAWGQGPDWVVPHPVYLALGGTAAERQSNYRAICSVALVDDEVALVRSNVPIGLTPAPAPAAVTQRRALPPG
jgi:putative transposase